MSQASADAIVPYKLYSTNLLNYWVGKEMVWLDFPFMAQTLLSCPVMSVQSEHAIAQRGNTTPLEG